ncbi:hypothetical protein RGU70_14360 [Herbaspirillum sp. RTI4]|uniref:cytochrome oxidase putative small subunit CydP n=1 Tax=Herbaspirillum sp. RTI4 TaxID=3048640 RepID=UPI002AB3B996|nr:cytochrome oxidase putative small subunit CydP [Herbaspirillum sp. RTI4]MDY7579498.1 hypothetical protein [Herbaspirillum sp. RTI4]MEA9980412.1 hypothetical protein [Herbaspirillum sp. RTI4]
MRLRSRLQSLFSAYRGYTKLPLWLEITLILIVKITLLTLLARTFFSEPQAKKMRMPTDLVEQHFLNEAPTPAVSVPHHLSPEVKHDSH